LLERGDEVVHFNCGKNTAPAEMQTIHGDRHDYAEFEQQVRNAGTFDCVSDMAGCQPQGFKGNIMAAMPDYSTYSLEELYDVSTHINVQRYPERYAAVTALIKQRLEQDSKRQQKPTQQRPLFPMMPPLNPLDSSEASPSIKLTALCALVILLPILLLAGFGPFVFFPILGLIILAGSQVAIWSSSRQRRAVVIAVLTMLLALLFMVALAAL
jgi:hypothetical protein